MRGLFDQSTDALIYGVYQTNEVLGANPRAIELCGTDDKRQIASIKR